MFGQHTPVMPDEETRLALRTADQLRSDIANLECGQEFLMQRINQLPTARDLWRAATLIAFVSAVSASSASKLSGTTFRDAVKTDRRGKPRRSLVS
jgi:hypothetical protein